MPRHTRKRMPVVEHAPLPKPAVSTERSGSHFELLVAEEGARPVIIPIANPPIAPARIPIRTRNFAFSRMEVLCLTGEPPNVRVHRFYPSCGQKEVQTDEILASVCEVELHIVMQYVSSGARSWLEVPCKPMILQAWTFGV